MTITHILVDFDNVKPTAADIGLVHGDRTRLAVVRGPQQTRYEADLAEALHALGERVTFTRCAKAGKNAADMQIAFLLGEIVAGLPAGSHKGVRFVVISKDKDFDPLLAYLQAKGFDATRAPGFKAALGGKAEAPARPAKPRAGKTSAPTAVKAAPVKAAAKKAAAKKAPAARKPVPTQPAAKKPAHAAARSATKAPAAPDPLARVVEGLQRKGDERPGKRKGLERFIESHLGRNLAPGQLDELVTRLERDGVLVFHDNKVEYRLPKAKK